MEPFHDDARGQATNSDLKHGNVEFSIASFNILAESYLTPRSHKNLPPSSADVVFDKALRRKLLCDTLEKLTKSFDILCLQELDHALQDVVFERLENLGYSYVYAPRGGVSIRSSGVNMDDTAEMPTQAQNNSEENVRSDGCATFFCKKRWKCVKFRIVNFDDLADESRPLLEDSNVLLNNNDCTSSFLKKKSHSPISGIIASYKRRNTALVVELEHRIASSAKHVVVANAHLYWHPGYEYVKLSQAHYLVHKVKQFVDESAKVSQSPVIKKYDDQSDNSPIVLICGDMNSKPNSAVHQYFTQGQVDARLVAPWNFSYDEMQEQQELALQMEQLSINVNAPQDQTVISSSSCNVDIDQDPVVGVELECDSDGECSDEKQDDNQYICQDETNTSLANQNTTISQVNEQIFNDRSYTIQPTRYLLDVTLNKFSRWLRILGQDAVLETSDEEKLRTGQGIMLLFERCRNEKRNLITTSKTLLVRKDCPPGTYLVNPSTTESLEEALVNLLLLHGVTLYPDDFLSRCVVCNGAIIEVFDRAEQKAIFVEYGSPDLMEELDHVYKCSSCGQGYWWSSSPNSSASRVKDACTHLLKLCLRGGVKVEGQPEFFSHVNYEEERKKGRMAKMKNQLGTNYHHGAAIEEVLGWLKTENLYSPFDLKSSYATERDGTVDGELLPFTNVTSDFVGALDYIFFEKKRLQQLGRFAVPKSFTNLNVESEPNGHLLPNKYWPSDHLCIGAKFSLANSSNDDDNIQIASAFVPPGMPTHLNPQLGCNCGCIPKVLSLFQMAELRKQAKLKKASEKLN